MDAAVPADAKNAPTGTWKTAQNAVSHSRFIKAPTHALLTGIRREKVVRDVEHPPHTQNS
jgi:hypothetical protein